MGSKKGLLYVTTLLVAYCSISYELILAQCLSAILGNSVQRFTLTIGLYLFCLGLGAWWVGRFSATQTFRQLLWIELILSWMGMWIPLLIFGFEFLIRQFCHRMGIVSSAALSSTLIWIVAHSMIVGIGLLSGMELPLLMRLAEKIDPQAPHHILFLDYLSSFVGAVSFPFLIYFTLGLVAGSAYLGFLNSLSALLLIAWGGAPFSRKFQVWGYVTCGVGLALWIAEENIRTFIIQHLFLAPL